MADLVITHTESVQINGAQQGATNTQTIEDITEVYKRTVNVPASEVELLNFGTAVSAGTFIEGDVMYLRITNKSAAKYLYLVCKNEYNNEVCFKLDFGATFIYNADNVSGVIDTFMANQIALGFVDATGDLGTGDAFIDNITANGSIIPGLRVSHNSGLLPANSSVGAVTGANAGVSAATSHATVTRHATTGVETASDGTGNDTNGTSTYAAGFGDLVQITAEADSGECLVEVFVASK